VADEVIRVEHLRKSFQGAQAVVDLSFAVRGTEVLGIIGPNGAGKTTVFNLLAGSFRPDVGRIIYEGRDITRLPAYRRLRLGIARTFQLVQPFRSLTVGENLMVSATASGAAHAEARERTERGLRRFGLAHAASRRASSLNAVEAKRLEVARAFASQPRVLLLDEIFTGLSDEEVRGLAALLLEVRGEGITVLLIEHNVTAVRLVADRVLAMDAGARVSEGTPEAVFTDPAVIESYLGRRSIA